MESKTADYVNEMADVVTDAIETILMTQDACEEMDELLTDNEIEHRASPDSCRLIHLTAQMAQLRTFLLSDVLMKFIESELPDELK